MTFYVLGLQVVTPQGQTWALAPHTSGLSAAEGGFETPLGSFDVSWTLKNGKETTINVNTPEGTSGTVTLPAGVGKTVKVNGKTVETGESGTIEVAGGNHTITTS